MSSKTNTIQVQTYWMLQIRKYCLGKIKVNIFFLGRL